MQLLALFSLFEQWDINLRPPQSVRISLADNISVDVMNNLIGQCSFADVTEEVKPMSANSLTMTSSCFFCRFYMQPPLKQIKYKP